MSREVNRENDGRDAESAPEQSAKSARSAKSPSLVGARSWPAEQPADKPASSSKMPVAAAEESSPDALFARRPRVLVVDDFDDARDLYCTFLECEGFAPFGADSGVSALELIDEVRPDVIVLDISMPMMDGWAVVRALQSNPATRRLPIIVLTGAGFGGSASRQEPGCAAYLLKPCPPATLSDVIRSVLRGATEERVRTAG